MVKGSKQTEEAKIKIRKARAKQVFTIESQIKRVATRKSNGYIHSIETRKKISESNTGKHPSDETKKRMSNAQKNKIRPHVEETKRKIGKSNSIALKGRKLTEEHKNNISKRNAKYFLGKKLSKKHRENISNGKKGTYPSKETRKKLSEAGRGRIVTEETKEKIRKSKTGGHLTEVTKEKLRKCNLGKNIGNKNWNWKNGITPLLMQIRHSFECEEWRRKVFRHDNYTCQKTKIKGKKLEAHHIKSFAKILEENSIKTIEESKECRELWDVNNGITLLKECHIEFHKQYGLRNNTKKQLTEFLKNNNQ